MFRPHSSAFGPPRDPTTAPLRLFGGPVLLEEDAEVKLTPYQAALVSLVWCHGYTGISRSRVAWLLWENEDDAPTRHKLSQLLHVLGARVGTPLIRRDEDDLRPAAGVESDLGRLRITGATRPITGLPLGRLQPPHPTPSFEKWLTSQRTTLRYLALERNAELVAAAEERHEYELVADAARAVLEYDPVNERALRSLIRALALAGSALQAEAAYERHAEIVRGILSDWTPSRETRRLLAGIDGVRRRQESLAGGRDIRHPVRLVGRKDELSELRRICLGDGAGWCDVVITGEPGIGKSRLLEELARQLELEDCRMIRVRSFAAEEGIAFNLLSDIAKTEPFKEAMRTLAPLWRKILASALSIEPVDVPEEDLPEVPADSASRRVYEALRQLFDAVEGRVVILADGFGAADSSSLAALSFLRSRVSSGIRFVGTVGTGEQERLSEVMQQATLRLDLGALSGEETGKLAAHYVTTKAHPAWIERIVNLSGGVPLFAVELARAVKEGDDPHLPAEIPLAVEDILTRTFADLAPRTKALLNILSVQLRPASIELLAAVAEQDVLEALMSLEEARGKQLISGDDDGIRFRHGLFRSWVYESLSRVERRFLHRATTEELISTQGDAACADLASHFHLAELPDEAFSWARKSASRASEHSAFPDVLRFLRIASETAVTPADRFRSLHKEGSLLFDQGATARSAAVLAEALDTEAPDIPDRDYHLAKIRWARAAFEVGDLKPQEAAAALREIEGRAEKSGLLDVLLAALDAGIVIANEAMEGEFVRRILRRAEEFPRRTDRALRCRVELLRTFNFLYGNVAEGVRAADTALRLAMDQELEAFRVIAATRYIIVHWGTVTLSDEELGEVLSAAGASAKRTGQEKQFVRALVNASSWYLDTRQEDRAHQYLLRSEEAIAKGTIETGGMLDVNWGEYFVLKGEYEQASKAFAEGMRKSEMARKDIFHTAAAGYALCELEMGRLAAAKNIVDHLPRLDHDDRIVLNFDPTTLISSQIRLAEVLGKRKQAIDLVSEIRSRIKERNLLAWLKMTLLEARLRKKHRMGSLGADLEEVGRLAERRGLTAIERIAGRLARD